MMEIQKGDIIGEDTLIYDRDNSYSAKVISKEAVFFKINNADFTKHFGKVINIFKKVIDVRAKFLIERFNKVRFEQEYRCLKYNSHVSATQ